MAAERAHEAFVRRTAGHVGRQKTHLFENPLHNGVQTPCADVLGGLIHLECEFGHLAQSFRCEVQPYSLGFQRAEYCLVSEALGSVRMRRK